MLAAATRTRRSTDTHILVIDCFHGVPNDIDRCAAVVTRTALPVHIVHPREQAVRDLEEVAGRPLIWLPSAATIETLLDKLHALRALAVVEAETVVVRPPLSPREQEVAELLADGRTNAEIATALRMTGETAKTHVRAILQKFDVATRQEFGRLYRADG